MKGLIPRAFVAFTLGLPACFPPAFAQIKVEEQPMGPAAPRSEAYMVSPRGGHFGVLAAKGSRSVMVADGVAAYAPTDRAMPSWQSFPGRGSSA
jgi:hypothetical protein